MGTANPAMLTNDPTVRTALQFARDEQAAGTHLVPLGQQAAIRPCPDNGRKAIGAHGLDGNIALLVFLEIPRYPLSRVALLGHYSPRNLLTSAMRFQVLLRRHLVKGMQAQVLLVTPGVWTERDAVDDDDAALMDIVPSLGPLAPWWHAALISLLPGLRRVAERHYHSSPHPDIADHGTILVEFPHGRSSALHVLVEGQRS